MTNYGIKQILSLSLSLRVCVCVCVCVCACVCAYVCVCLYKKSSEAGRVTRDGKVTLKTYSKNKIHTICVKKRVTNDFYVIWAKIIDLQKRLVHRNLCHVAMKKK